MTKDNKKENEVNQTGLYWPEKRTEDTFYNMWQSFRTRKHPALETKCFHMYEESRRYKILVKVVDIVGNDTNKLLEVKT